MATHTEISKSNQAFQPPMPTRTSIWPVVVVAFLILSLVGIAVSLLTPKGEVLNRDNRPLEAWAARYQGVADTFAAKDALISQRALEAWAARYQGVANASAAKVVLNSQRALEAWAARYQGLAEASVAKDALNSQRALEAWTARYQGSADSFASQR